MTTRFDATLDLGTIALTERAVVQARFVDEQGKAVECWYDLRDLERERGLPSLELLYTLYSNLSGVTTLWCGCRLYSLEVNDSKFVPQSVAIDATAGDVRDLTITLRKGTPVVLQPREPGKSRWLEVTITGDGGQPVWSREISSRWRTRVRLLPGSYRLVTSEDGVPLAEIEFTVGSDPLLVRY